MARLYRRLFNRSRTSTRCSFLMNASLIKVTIRYIWSMVLLLTLKPVCRFERRLLGSSNQVSLRLIILSRVLLVQLVKAIGQ